MKLLRGFAHLVNARGGFAQKLLHLGVEARNHGLDAQLALTPAGIIFGHLRLELLALRRVSLEHFHSLGNITDLVVPMGAGDLDR